MKKISYKQAGVNIDKADRLITNIKKLVDTTRVPGSMDSIGGFAAFFDPSKTALKGPILVASTDGVGTKLKIAQIADKHDTIGIDLVAMSVNDILCSGAKPLFFLDYFATGKLDNRVWTEVLKGIVRGCRMAGCALLGGETAEMPGMYPRGEYDLAGFAVGAVERKKAVTGRTIKAGDVVLGLASSGLHSNGYSLVRKIFSKKELKKHSKLFLAPTVIYVKAVLEASRRFRVKGIAHITGSGFYGNIPRILPAGTKVVIKKNSWKIPAVYELIKEKADISEKEFYQTFNMGVGMVLVLSPRDAEKAKKFLAKRFKLKSWIVGQVIEGKRSVEIE